MIFTKRDERELSEIKELTHELGKGAQEVLERLGHINELHQRQLVAQSRGSAGSDGRDARPLLAFVHIPKTAGGTVTNMLARAYSKSGVNAAGNYMTGPEQAARKVTRRPGGWEAWQRKGGRVTIGHVPYRVFREHLPLDTVYMTFLREPVDRVLSHYYRHIHRPDLQPANRVQARERRRERAASLEEALVETRLPQVRNLATRFLCGYPTRDEDLAASALENAKANLRNFWFVGIQERFEESLVLLQRMLGLDLVPYLNRHVSVEGRRPAVHEITDAQRALIEEHNSLDVELYRFGLGLFEDAVARAGKRFEADVKQLPALSAELNADALQSAREWLDRALPPGTSRRAAELRAEAKAAGIPMAALKPLLASLNLEEGKKPGESVKTLTRSDGSDGGQGAPDGATPPAA
jgi:hypothetical protein